MIARNPFFEDFQKNISDLLARTPAADAERAVKAFMTQAFARMDLVTREEFDIQVELLARALEQLRQLEARVQALEDGILAKAAASGATAQDTASVRRGDQDPEHADRP